MSGAGLLVLLFVLIPRHRFVNGAVDEGSGVFLHRGGMLLDDGSLLRCHAYFHFYKLIYIFFVGTLAGFCQALVGAFIFSAMRSLRLMDLGIVRP